MKLLFIVTGIGYGDAIREDAVIRTFLKKYPNTEILIGAYDNSYEYFKKKYRTIRIRGYDIKGEELKFKVVKFLRQNYFLPLIWFVILIKLIKITSRFRPDAIISDFEPVGPFLAMVIKKPCFTIFGYDPEDFKKLKTKNQKLRFEAKYFEKIYEYSDHVIIPKLLGSRKGKYHYVNPVLLMQPEELANKKELMKKLKIRKEPIVVMLGGSSFGEKLGEKIIEVAEHLNEEFIIFGGRKNFKQGNVKHFRFNKDVMEYVKVAKGVITLGGHLALSECIAYKKPMMIFPIKDHVEQILNAENLKHIGMVRNDLRNFKEGIYEFLENLKVIKNKIPKIRMDGAEQIVEIIMEKIRK